MGELAEGVQDGELGVRGREKCQRQGYSTSDYWVTIVKLNGQYNEIAGEGE